MKNILMQDFSIQENCNIILRGSYPQIAKQVAEQLLIVLESRQASAQSAELATLRAQLAEARELISEAKIEIGFAIYGNTQPSISTHDKLTAYLQKVISA